MERGVKLLCLHTSKLKLHLFSYSIEKNLLIVNEQRGQNSTQEVDPHSLLNNCVLIFIVPKLLFSLK